MKEFQYLGVVHECRNNEARDGEALLSLSVCFFFFTQFEMTHGHILVNGPVVGNP